MRLAHPDTVRRGRCVASAESAALKPPIHDELPPAPLPSLQAGRAYEEAPTDRPAQEWAWAARAL
eukprot:gene17742-22815_t